MSQYVEVQCPVILTDSGDAHGTSSRRCEGGLLVGLTWEPGESNWGADADGNRGIYVPGFWVPSEIPDKCDTCGFVFTDAGKEQIDKEAMEKAESLEEPYSDYDDQGEDE